MQFVVLNHSNLSPAFRHQMNNYFLGVLVQFEVLYARPHLAQVLPAGQGDFPAQQDRGQLPRLVTPAHLAMQMQIQPVLVRRAVVAVSGSKQHVAIATSVAAAAFARHSGALLSLGQCLHEVCCGSGCWIAKASVGSSRLGLAWDCECARSGKVLRIWMHTRNVTVT